MFTEAELRICIREAIGAGRLIIVSNREPPANGAGPAGGLAAALQPIAACSGGIWITNGHGFACRTVRSSGASAYTLRRVAIEERLDSAYYSGLANRGLWPLCHNVFCRPRFSRKEWDSYAKVNALFADAVLEEAAGEPGIVFIQDYHFGLLPRILKERNPNLKIAQFWHIPWPSAEIFSAFPWREELIEGMLGNDVLGFQLRRHCSNFLDAVEECSESMVDREQGFVAGPDSSTIVRAFPIGIDFEETRRIAASPATRAAAEQWKHRVGENVEVGIGIDRIDYTKGIPERIRALDVLLRRRPEWRGRLVLIQVGVPSRSDIPEYHRLAGEIDEEIAAVNDRWRTATWQPIEFIRQSLPPVEMAALHQIATFCLVTSLHDGMNLVAKEFVASRADLDGVLVLSRFAGAARELTTAVEVNPFCEEDIAEGIETALNLPLPERRRRMIRMRAVVQSNNVYGWAAGIMSALARVGTRGRRAPVLVMKHPASVGQAVGVAPR